MTTYVGMLVNNIIKIAQWKYRLHKGISASACGEPQKGQKGVLKIPKTTRSC